MLIEINSAVKRTKKQIEEASHIIITLGTSWVYKFIETNEVVANCHKILQKKFLKEILSVNQITKSLANIISLIKAENKKAAIIFTISPVRHLKDGFIENQQSKSHLIAAIHQVINEQKELYYFPAYEIMMDDLRDYRFYKSDLIHPNETAINYIWKKFIAAWVDNSAIEIMNAVDSVQKGLLHKPFYENSKKHQEFLEKLNQKIQKLKKEKNINL
jgi:lysophospholipase L1-like esterase